MLTSKAQELLAQLYRDPTGFRDRGGPFDLLQEYFGGLPVESLRNLLQAHHPIELIRSGIWIASELGRDGCCLLDEALSLLALQDRYITYHVLDMASICGAHARPEAFVHIASTIESDDQVLARRAAWLASNAREQPLRAALKVLGKEPGHRWGLEGLLHPDSLDSSDLVDRLSSGSELAIRYTAAIARKKGLRMDSLEEMPDPVREEVESILQRGR